MGVIIDPKTCLVVSIFMDNINPMTVELHKLVVQKYNVDGYQTIYAKTNLSHGETMDEIWKAKGLEQIEHIMFLDIDAVPVVQNAFRNFFELTHQGVLVGNAQRSNHIENNQHEFAAPSAVAMSRATYEKIGKPSAVPTPRGDVGEEYTYAAEAAGVPVVLLMPFKYDRPVKRFAWEKDQSATWKLADGHPEYGVGTTFAIHGTGDTVWPIIWHSFQSFHQGHQEAFWEKCRELLGG